MIPSAVGEARQSPWTLRDLDLRPSGWPRSSARATAGSATPLPTEILGVRIYSLAAARAIRRVSPFERLRGHVDPPRTCRTGHAMAKGSATRRCLGTPRSRSASDVSRRRAGRVRRALSAATGGRLAELRDRGVLCRRVQRELRGAFVSDAGAWGGMILLREAGAARLHARRRGPARLALGAAGGGPASRDAARLDSPPGMREERRASSSLDGADLQQRVADRVVPVDAVVEAVDAARRHVRSIGTARRPSPPRGTAESRPRRCDVRTTPEERTAAAPARALERTLAAARERCGGGRPGSTRAAARRAADRRRRPCRTAARCRGRSA